MTAYEPVVAPPLRPGVVGDDLVAGVPLGFLTATHVRALASVTDTVVVTPWRSVVVPGGAGAAPVLASAGLVTEPDSPWSGLSACTGAPACAKARCSTTDLADELVASGVRAPGEPAASTSSAASAGAGRATATSWRSRLPASPTSVAAIEAAVGAADR